MLNTENTTSLVNLNIYCQSRGLLFQFILSEFLTSYSKVNEIEGIYSSIESELIKNRLQADIESSLSQTLTLIPMLTGAQMEITDEQTFPWTHNKGSLNKLRYYCFLFGQKNIENPDAVKMNICVSKAFHSALQLREVILSLQHQILDGTVPNYVSLYHLLDKLIDNMRLASRLILKLLIQYKDDENILYFLLKNQKDFDVVYDTPFVAKVLKKMYPEGLKFAKDLIVEKYVKRGFGYLIGFISKKMAELEANENSEVSI